MFQPSCVILGAKQLRLFGCHYCALFRHTIQPQYQVSLCSSGSECSAEEDLKQRKLNIEITDMGSLQLKSSWGKTDRGILIGVSTISVVHTLRPSLVKRPSLSSALKECSCSSAIIRLSTGGASIKSKWSRSLMPIVLSWRTVVAKLVRWISGTGVGSISSLYARSVYRR